MAPPIFQDLLPQPVQKYPSIVDRPPTVKDEICLVFDRKGCHAPEVLKEMVNCARAFTLSELEFEFVLGEPGSGFIDFRFQTQHDAVLARMTWLEIYIPSAGIEVKS